ncbi:MAG: aldose 1-epimerase [Alphaproteobacteria bacterium]|nr:aldose 1-epimerase [Alphaproteobacteria bacterium]
MEEIILQNDNIKIGVMPELGASLSFFRYTQNNEERDILRPYEDTPKGPDSNNASMFPMVPFCGRIRGGDFVYFGITRKMQKNQNGIADPIHGDGWKSVWKVENVSATKITLSLAHNKEDGGFPFSYNAEIVYELTGNALNVTMSVYNPGALPMPCGLGIHPFFVKTREVELDFAADTVWSNEADPIFDKPYDTPMTWRFDGGRPLKNAVFDTCFGGFDGRASILYPDLGISVSITADDQFKHVVLYSPRGKDFFCLEPTSNASNAFNLAANGVIGTGMKSIGPSQKMIGKMTIAING